MVTDEGGASVYSASELAVKELPNLSIDIRGAVSIARRLQDPLAEFVKVDPISLGVGLYQHDVDENRLMKELTSLVQCCVSGVGVDVNTASASLLQHVAGLNQNDAQAIVSTREVFGPFKNRAQILNVISPKTFEQAAGFLRIYKGTEPLDETIIHPDSYEHARLLQIFFGKRLEKLSSDEQALEKLRTEGGHNFSALVPLDLDHKNNNILNNNSKIGLETVRDLILAIRGDTPDPRKNVPCPHLKRPCDPRSMQTASGAVDAQLLGLELADLQPNMRLLGIVRNVVSFGAFIDVGVQQDALLHVSQFQEYYFNFKFNINFKI